MCTEDLSAEDFSGCMLKTYVLKTYAHACWRLMHRRLMCPHKLNNNAQQTYACMLCLRTCFIIMCLWSKHMFTYVYVVMFMLTCYININININIGINVNINVRFDSSCIIEYMQNLEE